MLGIQNGCVATFQKRQESDWSSWPGSVSCRHLEQVVDELNLSPNIRTAHPPRLPLPDQVHGLVALDRSPRRVECTKPLLGLHASFDRSMILLHDVVQVLDRPVAATASQESFFFTCASRIPNSLAASRIEAPLRGAWRLASSNEVRSHASLKGHTPLTFAGGRMVARAELNNVR